MGWIKDLLTEVPLSAVMRDRVALAEQKYDQAVAEVEELRQRVADLEKEVAELRPQVPSKPAGGFSDEMRQVLVYLFRSRYEDRDVGSLGRCLQMERSLAQFHLDQLETRGLAEVEGGNEEGYVCWDLTPEGRSYVVENGLISKE